MAFGSCDSWIHSFVEGRIVVLSIIKKSKLNLLLLGILSFFFVAISGKCLTFVYDNVTSITRSVKLASRGATHIEGLEDGYSMNTLASVDNLARYKSFFEKLNSYGYDFAISYSFLTSSGEYEQLQVNDTWILINNLKVKKGRLFSDEEFDNSSNCKNVVVGYNVAKGKACGDEFIINYQKYKIIGILPKGAKYEHFNGLMTGSSLDDTILIAYGSDRYNDINDFAVYDMIISGMTIMEKKSNLSELESILDEIEGANYRLDDYSEVVRDAVTEAVLNLVSILAVMCLLYIFIFAIFFVCFSKLMKNNFREIAIRRICGADNKIVIRDFSVVLFVALALPCVVLVGDMKHMICSAIAALFYVLLMRIYMRYYMKKYSAVDLMNKFVHEVG